MIRQRRKFWPYAILGLIFAFAAHRFVAEFRVVPKSQGLVDIMDQLPYVLDHYLKRPYFLWDNSIYALEAAAAGFLIAMLLYLRFTPGGTYRRGEESGSARYATAKELKSFEDKESQNNIIFTKKARMGLFNSRLPYDRQLNKNVLAVGLPGDGKTRYYVKPNLMQMNATYIVTDPKGLLVHEVGKMLEENGYKIKVFDLVNLTNSNTFNPFNYMKSELDIDRLAEAVVEGTKKSDNQGEDVWVKSNLLLTRALLGYLYFDSQLEGYTPNLSQVADLLRIIDRKDPDHPSPLEILFNKLEKRLPGNYACRQWELFLNYRSDMRSSVIGIMTADYSVFDHEAVRDLISSDSMEINTWNTQKTAVFIAIPETNKAFNFLSSILFAFIFEELTHGVDAILQGHRKDEGLRAADLLHVRVIIDEFANIGRIPNFTEIQASVRSREISIEIIIQAISQLKKVYPKDWETIFNNCASLLYLGTNDKDTMDYFSKRAGLQTITQVNYSESRGRNRSGSTSYSSRQRPLLTPDEVARIGVDEALFFISKQNVFRDKKVVLNKHPMAKRLSNSFEDTNWYTYYRDMKNQDIAEFTENTDQSTVIDRGQDYHQFITSLPFLSDKIVEEKIKIPSEGRTQTDQSGETAQNIVTGWEQEAG
ncbi:type IV secretory system conjugative DNA transfer family protein [Streptococcus mutans OMZ175]|uniref:VirD4-like conjugal transfer protein, CD1115 family n=1 Tax=Streptococcus mutans TaxID=1309 RepID=UPI0002B57180|nr:type IV secretory system conjugative DNA transfer family protein [Streptococcus mutans]EMC59276.1 Putative TraG protein [Streptococcus mutans OMZ175]QZS44791.1 type IV secretory system conjugative DNA transfer family protein [Streptococcus mutans OMZ175]